jgi:ArsR family transcriptional regulator
MARSGKLESVASAIGDPVRAQILDLLARGRHDPCCSPTNPEMPAAVCACDIRDDLGGMAPSKLAYHLRLLREAGLVREAKRGKWVYYTLDRETFAVFLHRVKARWSGAPARSRRAGSRR